MTKKKAQLRSPDLFTTQAAYRAKKHMFLPVKKPPGNRDHFAGMHRVILS
jgi:hypothetical protein